MHNNTKIKVSDHAARRFIQKIFPDAVKKLDHKVSNDIKEIFRDSVYITDNKAGIVFRNNTFRIDLIVKNRTIVTIIKHRL